MSNLNFCSRLCSNQSLRRRKIISEKHKGKVLNAKTKEKLRKYTGEKSSGWKGGKPKCKDCGKGICYDSTYCNSCKVTHRTKEHIEKLGRSISKSLAGKMPQNINREGIFSNVKRGWFEIGEKKLFFRSKWEVNYFIYLSFLVEQNRIKTFGYEQETFNFENTDDGINSYCPDFKIINNDDSIEYHEVKGWITPRSKMQLEKMRICFPKTKLILIDSVCYRDLKKQFGKTLNFQ